MDPLDPYAGAAPGEDGPEPPSARLRFTDFFQTMAQGVVFQDADGRITAANPAAERILGADAARMAGWADPRWDAVQRDGTPYPSGGHPDARALGTGCPVLREIVGVRSAASGERRWLSLSAVPRFRPGDPHPYEVYSVFDDVTEASRQQEYAHLAEKLEAVGRLAGGMAHDFNNLLAVIQGTTDLLLMEVDGSEAMHDDLGEIRRACERASALTQQLLAFSRRQLLQPQDVDLHAFLREAEPELRRIVGSGVRLGIEAPGAATLVSIDPAQLREVVSCLAAFARESMPHGGSLTLTARPLRIAPGQAQAYPYAVVPGEYGELVVRDTGEPVGDDYRRNVFEPFFTTGRGGTTGLGMATVYGIVKQSRGYIWAEAAPEGNQFRVCLPRAAGPPAAPPAQGGDRPTRRAEQRTILVVEDEDGVRAVARRVLEREGYAVLEASDALAALELCGSHAGPIHLVLTDVVMPGMSGRELIDRLRPLRPDARVLYMSGYSDEHLSSYGVSGEALNLIGKPFTPSDLAERVRTLLQRG